MAKPRPGPMASRFIRPSIISTFLSACSGSRSPSRWRRRSACRSACYSAGRAPSRIIFSLCSRLSGRSRFLAWVPLAIIMFPGSELPVIFPDLPRLFLCDGAQHDARRQIDRQILRACGELPRRFKITNFQPCDRAGCDALHLHRIANLGRRRLVFACRSRDGVGPIRPRLSHQHVLHDGRIPDDRDRHADARDRGLSHERAGSRRRRVGDARACAPARDGG